MTLKDILISGKLTISEGGGGGGGVNINDCFTRTGLTGDLVLDTATELAISALYGRSGITALYANEVTILVGGNTCQDCTSLRTVSLGKLETATGADNFRGCTSLETVDLGNAATVAQRSFYNAANLKTLILRRTSAVQLPNVNAFDGTPFANGGAGGVIYVPSALMSTYLTYSNWPTVNGYGTITWKAIEGSFYETHYADGTPIS